MRKIGSIKKLERNIQGHSCNVFEVGKEIAEIKDVSLESDDGNLYPCWEIHYRSGVVLELHGGIITITRNAVIN